MSTPYLGQTVLYQPGPYDEFRVGAGLLAAIVTRVLGDCLVDVMVFGYGIGGTATSKSEVRFREPDGPRDPMPYCQALPGPAAKGSPG